MYARQRRQETGDHDQAPAQPRRCIHEEPDTPEQFYEPDETSPLGRKQRPRLAGDRVAPLPLLEPSDEVAALAVPGVKAATGYQDWGAGVSGELILILLSWVGESEPRVDRLALHRQDAEDAFVHSVKGLATHKPLQRFRAEGEFADRESSLSP